MKGHLHHLYSLSISKIDKRKLVFNVISYTCTALSDIERVEVYILNASNIHACTVIKLRFKT